MVKLDVKWAKKKLKKIGSTSEFITLFYNSKANGFVTKYLSQVQFIS